MILDEHGPRKWQGEEHGWVKRHSLSLALVGFVLAQLLTTLVTGHRDWVTEEAAHGKTVSGWPTEFWWHWGYDYATSLAAEPWGVLVIVMLSKWLYEAKSAESK